MTTEDGAVVYSIHGDLCRWTVDGPRVLAVDAGQVEDLRPRELREILAHLLAVLCCCVQCCPLALIYCPAAVFEAPRDCMPRPHDCCDPWDGRFTFGAGPGRQLWTGLVVSGEVQACSASAGRSTEHAVCAYASIYARRVCTRYGV